MFRIPVKARPDVSRVLESSIDEIKLYQDVLGSLSALESEEHYIDALTSRLEVEPTQAIGIAVAVRNLRTARETLDISASELFEFLRADGFETPSGEAAAELADLLESESGHLLDKAHKLQLAVLPHLVSASTVCDVRPVLSRDRQQVKGALVLCLFELVWHDTEHGVHRLTLQLDRDDIVLLREALDTAEKKMDVIQKTFAPFVSPLL